LSGTVTIKLAGIQHNLRVTLSLAPKLEAATGQGVIALAREMRNLDAPTSVVVEILRAALADNGKVYTSDDVFNFMCTDGLMPAYNAATKIVAALFESPKDAQKGKGAPAKSGQ